MRIRLWRSCASRCADPVPTCAALRSPCAEGRKSGDRSRDRNWCEPSRLTCPNTTHCSSLCREGLIVWGPGCSAAAAEASAREVRTIARADVHGPSCCRNFKFKFARSTRKWPPSRQSLSRRPSLQRLSRMPRQKPSNGPTSPNRSPSGAGTSCRPHPGRAARHPRGNGEVSPHRV